MNARTAALADTDREVHAALERERERQTVEIELIASENIVSRAVREALGHEITNKTLEGYPGGRFHGGGRNVDVIERLAIERAKALFGAEYVNVQPHSGTQENQAVFFALAEPGNRRRSGTGRHHVEQEPDFVRCAPSVAVARSASGGVRGDDARVRHRTDGGTRALHCRPDPRGSGIGARRGGANGKRDGRDADAGPGRKPLTRRRVC